MRGLVAFACALVLCACVAAQAGAWEAVEGVSPGSAVEVHSRAATVKGMLVGVSASGMDVQTREGATRHLDRRQITKVYLVGKSRELRDALIGGGIGSVGGVVLGLAVYTGCCTNYYPTFPQPRPVSKAAATAVYGAVIGGAGAIIGAVVGRITGHSKTLIYERDSGRNQKPAQRQNPMAAAGTAR